MAVTSVSSRPGSPSRGASVAHRERRLSATGRCSLKFIVAASILAAFAASCTPQSRFHCQADQDCDLGAGGRCLTTASGPTCAYEDPSCEAGWRADSICVEPTFPDAGETPTADGEPDGPKPVKKLWALLVGNSRADVTNPDDPIAKEPIVIYRPGANGYEVAWTSDELDMVRDVAWGDYDGDGQLDFAAGMAWWTQRRNRIYHNTGKGWEVVWTAPTPRDTFAVRWLDADGDGKLDLIASAKGSIMLYRNEGGGHFAERELVSVKDMTIALEVCSMALADFDHDGDVDIAVGTSEGPRVFANNGGGVFVHRWPTPVNTASGCGPVAWADYDHDGDEDLTVAGLINKGAEDLEIFAYADGTFTQAVTLYSQVRGLEQVHTSNIEWLDFDGDGDLDLATASYDAPPQSAAKAGLQRVYRNSGGSFAVAWTSPTPLLANSVAAADYDGDGKTDLAYGGDGQSFILHNLGATFEQVWTADKPYRTDAVSWAAFQVTP